ncbi:MAG: hypothetical protein JST80_08240 [Bdellovibrionales bacterium]|nr:hypothetical protein [Bdellovibrionales bacterium]
MRTRFVYLLLAFAVNHLSNAHAGAALDPNVAPKGEEEVSNVFRDMGVVQKRAMPKGERWLVSTYASFDFSDGPYSNYSFHVNPGYAVSDFVEIYLNFVPFHIVSPRSIVDKLQTQISPPVTVIEAKPKMQFGAEVLWAPLYGKDSMGISRIIRSDTFVKFGASMISFEGGDSGMSFNLGVGKTFFFSKNTGFRFCVDWGYMQQIINFGAAVPTKSFASMLLTEFGLTFYL